MSSLSAHTPLDDIEAQDEARAEAGTFGATIINKFLPSSENYAEDETIQQWVRQDLRFLTDWTRGDRQTLHEEWHQIRQMVQMKHGESRRYVGKSDYYIPVYGRNKSTLLSAYSRGLFPSDEYIDVSMYGNPGTPQGDNAQAVKLYMQWELDVNAGARNRMKEFLGQYVDYGISPMKVLYKKDRQVKGAYKQGSPGFSSYNCDGLLISPCNIFNWYIYPTTVTKVDQATLIFEDIEISLAHAENMVRKGYWVKDAVEKLQQSSTIAEYQAAQQRMMESRGTQTPLDSNNVGSIGQRYVVTECWTFAELPGKAYVSGLEERGTLLPTRIVMTAAGEALSVVRNPNWHQKPPYVVATTNQEPGYFYGFNHGKMTLALQGLTNDAANQMNDNGNYAMNPIAIMNPSMIMGKIPSLKPGVPFYVTDIANALKFDRPPMEQVQLGVQMMQLWLGMGQDMGGAPPIMQGGAGRGVAKTATGAQLAQKNAQTPIQDLVEDIENSVLIPLLSMAHTNAQQYRESEIMAAVSGKDFRITPEQIRLNATFRWMASSQAVNNQVRAQQAISLMQAMLPVVPILQQQGMAVDFTPLIKKVYEDGFGFRGFDAFIHPMQVPSLQMAGAPTSGAGPGAEGAPQAGGAAPPNGDRARSALEQLHGQFGGIEAQPGEAEEFMDVRRNADEMAAQQGAAGGMPV